MENVFLKDLRIVQIDSPYDTLDLPLTQGLFSQCAALKINSYRTVYPYGVLPVDAYEFISTHHFVCRERKDGSFEILMCYKSVTLEKCRTHLMKFPALGLLQASNAPAHAAALETLLRKHDADPRRVSYGGSWTVRPDIRANPAMKELMKELFIAILVHHEREIGTTERFCYGVLKVKTDQFFLNYGYTPLASEGGAMPPFESSALMKDPGIILQCTRFSEEAERLAGKYEGLWSRRLNIDAGYVAANKAA